jgi:hypothetical protein
VWIVLSGSRREVILMEMIDSLGVREMKERQFTSEEARFLYLKMIKKGMPPQQAYEETGKLIQIIQENHLKAKEQARQEKLSFRQQFINLKERSSHKVFNKDIQDSGRLG